MIDDNLCRFQAMVLHAALNIKIVIFTANHNFSCCYSARNSIRNIFMKLNFTPVTPKYIYLAFRDDGNHFPLQYPHNSTVDFKLVR